jgi:hypothetical protein
MAIKTFTDNTSLPASDINTFLANSGLVYIKQQSLTGTASTLVVTNAFSADYDNYRIVFNGTGTQAFSIHVGLGSSTTAYYGVLFYADSNTNTLLGNDQNNQSILRYVDGCSGASQPAVAIFDVLNPFKTTYSRFANGIYQDGDYYGTMQGEHRVASSFTGLSLQAGSGNFTGGTAFVYGYRKA